MYSYDILIAMKSGVIHGVSYETAEQRLEGFKTLKQNLKQPTILQRILGHTHDLISINQDINLYINPVNVEAIQIWDRQTQQSTKTPQTEPAEPAEPDENRMPEQTLATKEEVNPSYR